MDKAPHALLTPPPPPGPLNLGPCLVQALSALQLRAASLATHALTLSSRSASGMAPAPRGSAPSAATAVRSQLQGLASMALCSTGQARAAALTALWASLWHLPALPPPQAAVPALPRPPPGRPPARQPQPLLAQPAQPAAEDTQPQPQQQGWRSRRRGAAAAALAAATAAPKPAPPAAPSPVSTAMDDNRGGDVGGALQQAAGPRGAAAADSDPYWLDEGLGDVLRCVLLNAAADGSPTVRCVG